MKYLHVAAGMQLPVSKKNQTDDLRATGIKKVQFTAAKKIALGFGTS